MRSIKARKTVKIRINTMLTRLVNECLKKNINIVKVVYKNGFVEADIKYADYARFLGLCSDYNWETKTLKKYGLANSALLAVSRIGMILGVVVSIVALVFMQNFTINYKIVGNCEKDTAEIISQYLGKKYQTKNEKKYTELKNELLKREGIANANVYKKGLYVFVEIKEELPADSVIEEDEQKNIVSRYDAIVTRVITLSGTPLVAKDTRVKKGEILIDGYYIFQENKIETFAKGEVYGKVYATEKHTVMKEKNVKKRTGKEVVYTTVLLPAEKRSVDSILKNCPFADYEVEVSQSYLKGILPLRLFTVTAYEMETTTVIATQQSLTEFANMVIKQMTLNMGNNGILLDSFVKITDIGSAYVVDVFSEFETRIA